VPEPGRKAAFDLTRQAMGYRFLQLLALPLAGMDDASLQAALTAISAS
jgi:arsenate reductase